MIIEKKQTRRDSCIFQWSYFSAAREGLKSILMQPELAGKKILLPAYIGYSTREGSGVFDPVTAVGTPYVFYRMDCFLNIDVADLQKKIPRNPGQILFIIHYFGFKDKDIDRIKKLARAQNMVIIEDFAHAFYTFYNDQCLGFDYAIFSLHKMFPEIDGGMVLCNKLLYEQKEAQYYDLFRYNLPLIMERRRENYTHILNALRRRGRKERIRVMRPVIGRHVPQTFPILLTDSAVRDRMYFGMNEAGYGVVSLYHELIAPLDRSFSVEHNISSRILNLPVHQDISPAQLDGMLKVFFSLLKKD